MADAALVFSIARLAAPALELGLPDRFVLEQDLVHDALALGRAAEDDVADGGRDIGSTAGRDATGFAARVQAGATHPIGGTGGLLKLPQAFGSVYLGQSFAAIVTACNFSTVPLAMVGIKVSFVWAGQVGGVHLACAGRKPRALAMNARCWQAAAVAFSSVPAQRRNTEPITPQRAAQPSRDFPRVCAEQPWPHLLLFLLPSGRQVELATERSRLALLYDSTGQPLPHLQPGQRHDFTVRHDIKDLVRGALQRACSHGQLQASTWPWFRQGG